MREVTNTHATQPIAVGLAAASQMIGLSVDFLRGAVRRGDLRASRLGRRLVVKTAELEAFVDRGMKRESAKRNQ